jgi:hypothetical protein
MPLTTVSQGLLSTDAQYTGFKNRIINGAMMIDQRNAGAAVTQTAANIYSLDRWQSYGSQASKMTLQQSSTAPAGFSNSILVTSSSAYSVLSSDIFMLRQHIEGFNLADFGWGTSAAVTATLSFWVRSSLTGTFGGAFYSAGGTLTYPFNFTISAANTWEQKTITVTGPTTGGATLGNTGAVQVIFGLGAGSANSAAPNSWAASGAYTATGATSVVGTNGATFYITGVQIEKGSTATSFDYRPYGTELALCQRYYQKYTNVLMVSGYNATNGTLFASWIFPVPLRTTPTMVLANFTNVNSNSATANNSSPTEFRVVSNITSTGHGYSVFTAETSGTEL